MIVDLSGFTTGVCDRLRQFTFCIALANALGEDTLEVYEHASSESVGMLCNLFSVEGFNLLMLRQIPNGSHIHMTPFNSFPSLVSTQEHLLPCFNIAPSVFYRKWLDAYTFLKPSALCSLDPNLMSTRYDLGIHLRCTDRLSILPSFGSITKYQFYKFSRYYLPKTLKSLQHGSRVYLASDSESSFNTVREHIKHLTDFYYSPFGWHKQGIRQTSGPAFIYDLFSLANSSNILSTTGGGVPLTARLIAGHSSSSFKVWTSECISTRAAEYLRALKRFCIQN